MYFHHSRYYGYHYDASMKFSTKYVSINLDIRLVGRGGGNHHIIGAKALDEAFLESVDNVVKKVDKHWLAHFIPNACGDAPFAQAKRHGDTQAVECLAKENTHLVIGNASDPKYK